MTLIYSCIDFCTKKGDLMGYHGDTNNQWNDNLRIIHKNVANNSSLPVTATILSPWKSWFSPWKSSCSLWTSLLSLWKSSFPLLCFKKKHFLCENHEFPCKKSHVPCEHHHNPCENHHVLSKMATQSTARPARSAAAVRMTPAGSTLQSAQEALLEDLVFLGEDSDGSHFGLFNVPGLITPGWLIVVFPPQKKIGFIWFYENSRLT